MGASYALGNGPHSNSPPKRGRESEYVCAILFCACLIGALSCVSLARAQQHTLAFSSVDSPNANWYIAKDRGLYKKYGVDAELIFIPSSTTTIAAVVSGSVAVGNISGGATANAAVGGANVVA